MTSRTDSRNGSGRERIQASDRSRIQRPFAIAVAWLLAIACLFATPVIAQEDAGDVSDNVRQSSRPQMMRWYKPDVWGTYQIQLRNAGDQPVDVVTSGYSEGAPLLQYGRRVTLPPHSMRKVNYPVRPTANASGNIEWHGQLYAMDGSVPRLLRAADNYMVEAEKFPVATESITMVIADVGTTAENLLKDVDALAAATRKSMHLTLAVSHLTANDLPAQLSALDAVDYLILASNRMTDSAVQTDCLCQWVQNGGRLWVMLDLVESASVERLFIDSLQITPVGRTSLTQFQMWNRLVDKSAGKPFDFDYPVDFVRVVADDVEIIHEVDGWPASFAASLGEGQIIFTTLGAKAWLSSDPDTPNVPLEQLIDRWVQPSPQVPLQAAAFEPILSAQTGYEIPSRRTVLSVLFGFCALLATAGVVLQRPKGPRENEVVNGEQSSRRLEKLAVIGPAIALVCTGCLLWMGMNSRAAAPPTTVMTELVQVTPSGFGWRSNGSAVISLPDPMTANVTTSDSRLMLPASDRLEGTVRQLIWTDPRTATWEDYELRSGLQFFETSQSDLLAEPIRASMTLGPQGLEGELHLGNFSDPQDLVLATAAHHAITLDVDESGQFRAGPDDVVAPGDYIRAALMSDAQSQRNAIYRQLLDADADYRYPARPTLFAWVRSGSSGVDLPDAISEQHISLLSVPIEYRRTPPDTDVLIPAPLLPFTARSGQIDASGAWNARAGRWVPRFAGGSSLLRFALPDAVRPLKITGGRLQLKIAAPERSVVLSVGNAADRKELATLESPAGSFEYSFAAADFPEIDADEGAFVELVVGELEANLSDDIAEDRSWAMDYLQLELTGRTAPITLDEESE